MQSLPLSSVLLLSWTIDERVNAVPIEHMRDVESSAVVLNFRGEKPDPLLSCIACVSVLQLLASSLVACLVAMLRWLDVAVWGQTTFREPNS
mmetsp:Transcript_4372/g.13216  ORF Transcript_4372/g.13216 Transcript_4372/m.13216 type:complete len:92 (-) Transcript_4372:96-371(-)|eukprot:scaffold158_cov28-Tisochrysis_lutea.AAC.1